MKILQLLMVGLIAAGSAHATIIIQDDFSGDGTGNLNGTTADIGGTWTAHTRSGVQWLDDGSIASSSAADDYTAFIALPHEIAVGEIYTLTATLDSTTAPFCFVGLFEKIESDAVVIEDRLQHSNRGVMMDFHGPSNRRWSNTGPVGTQINGDMVASSATTMTLVIDASTGRDTLNNVSFYIDGVFQETSSFNLTGLDTLGIGSETAPGALDLGSVSLDVIPEPATLGMIVAFGGGMLFIRRRLMI